MKLTLCNRSPIIVDTLTPDTVLPACSFNITVGNGRSEGLQGTLPPGHSIDIELARDSVVVIRRCDAKEPDHADATPA